MKLITMYKIRFFCAFFGLSLPIVIQARCVVDQTKLNEIFRHIAGAVGHDADAVINETIAGLALLKYGSNPRFVANQTVNNMIWGTRARALALEAHVPQAIQRPLNIANWLNLFNASCAERTVEFARRHDPGFAWTPQTACRGTQMLAVIRRISEANELMGAEYCSWDESAGGGRATPPPPPPPPAAAAAGPAGVAPDVAFLRVGNTDYRALFAFIGLRPETVDNIDKRGFDDAIRNALRRYHPDKNTGDPISAQVAAKLNSMRDGYNAHRRW